MTRLILGGVSFTSLCPIFNFQSWYAAKFRKVIRYQRRVQTFRMGRNQGVQRANGRAGLFQAGANVAIMKRRRRIAFENFQRQEKLFQRGAIALWLEAFDGAKLQFSDRDDGDANAARNHFLQPYQYVRGTAADDGHADVGVQQMRQSHAARLSFPRGWSRSAMNSGVNCSR